jgi:hypothetical protein
MSALRQPVVTTSLPELFLQVNPKPQLQQNASDTHRQKNTAENSLTAKH